MNHASSYNATHSFGASTACALLLCFPFECAPPPPYAYAYGRVLDLIKDSDATRATHRCAPDHDSAPDEMIHDATRPPFVKDLRPPTFSLRHIATTLNRSRGTNPTAIASTEGRRLRWCRRETKLCGLPMRLPRRTVVRRRR